MSRKDARGRARTELQEALATVYTPGSPIKDPELFSGRADLLAELRLDLATRDKAAFVLYGERGTGKTSIWEVLLHGRQVQRHQASSIDDFVSIFFRVLQSLGEQFTQAERTAVDEATASIGAKGVASAGARTSEEIRERTLADAGLDLNLVLDRIAHRANSIDAIVIDEFQSISTRAVQTQIIDVVKAFADRNIAVKIFLVGVADSDDELIPNEAYRREYKERHFSVHRIPRMSDREALDIFDVRKRLYRVDLDDQVKKDIVRIASGYPATTHRLALAAAQAWTNRAFVATAFAVLVAVARGFGVPLHAPVKKAGVHVESQDLRTAVTKFATRFRENYPTVVESLDVLSSADIGPVERVLAVFESSPRISLPFEDLAKKLGLPRPDVEELLATHTGLVEHNDNDDCRLVVPGLLSYVQARRYLAT